MDKKLVGLVALFFLSFLFFLSVVLFNRPLSNLIRAKEDTLPSAQSSLLFVWPIDSKADGQSQVKIDVFVRSDSNKQLSNKQVRVSSTLGEVQPASAISDKSGKASFTLVSSTPGIAEVSAIADSTPLTSKITVRFE